MEHYKSRTNNFFHFSNPHDDDPWSEIEEEEEDLNDGGDYDGSYDYHFHPFRTLLDSGCTPTLPPDILQNSMDTPNVSYKELRTLNNGKLISEIDRTVKKLSVNLLCAIDGVSTRISQLDGKICQLDNVVDDLTNSAEHHHGKVDGKLKQLQKILQEVQDGVQFLRDKHEVAETQLQLAKVGSQRGHKSGVQTDCVHQVSLCASVQSYDPRHAVEAQLPGQLPQNQTLPPQPVYYYQPAWQTPDTAFQQYSFPPSKQAKSPQLLHFTRPPVLSPIHSLPGVVTSSNHSLLGHQPEEKTHMPSYSYFSSTYQSPSHPAVWGPSKEFDVGSELQMHGQPQDILQSPKAYNFAEMHPNNSLTTYPDSSTIKPFPFSSIPLVVDSGSNYARLPTAQISPHALPFATSVEAVVDSWGNSNSVPVDDVTEKVTAMGFRRDLVKATARKLMENGQSVDVNVVLDKVMNL